MPLTAVKSSLCAVVILGNNKAPVVVDISSLALVAGVEVPIPTLPSPFKKLSAVFANKKDGVAD